MILNDVYNNAISAIIYENNILNENNIIPSDIDLKNLEFQLDLILKSFNHKSDKNSKKLSEFIKKYSS